MLESLQNWSYTIEAGVYILLPVRVLAIHAPAFFEQARELWTLLTGVLNVPILTGVLNMQYRRKSGDREKTVPNQKKGKDVSDGQY